MTPAASDESPDPPGAEQPGQPRRFLPAPSEVEGRYVAELLRQETVGGALLLLAAVVGLVWANLPGDSYVDVQHFHLGPLSLEHWAADGGLALFFFLAGVELKRELAIGSLSRPIDALVPVAAAVAGMVMPALVYLAINISHGEPQGWAIPTATDIAFALAVLAVVGGSLPPALRAFLLTLAVVDDLGAITVIATVYTETIHLFPLAVAVVLLAAYAFCQKRRVTWWWLYTPLAIGTWWAVYESGVHATIAGVALGLLTRVTPDPSESEAAGERVEHRLRPFSAGFAVPFFALMSAGVSVRGGRDLFTDPVAIGVAVGLLVGKTIGVLAGAWTVARWTRAELSPDLSWRDMAGVAVLSGVGFTVSLLITDLAFGEVEGQAAKIGVLVGSLASGAIAALLLRRRNVHHRSRAPV